MPKSGSTHRRDTPPGHHLLMGTNSRERRRMKQSKRQKEQRQRAGGPNADLGAGDFLRMAGDDEKVDDLLRVYQSLGADDFGTEKDRAGSGVDDAEKTGGVVRVTLAGDRGDRALRVGKLTKSTTRWALAGSRWAIEVGGDGTLYALSPWTAGWAAADAGRFERAPADPPR